MSNAGKLETNENLSKQIGFIAKKENFIAKKKQKMKRKANRNFRTEKKQ